MSFKSETTVVGPALRRLGTRPRLAIRCPSLQSTSGANQKLREPVKVNSFIADGLNDACKRHLALLTIA